MLNSPFVSWLLILFFSVTGSLDYPLCSNPSQPKNYQATGADDKLPSLWTRQRGADWPSFLGKNRDGRSTETGILTDWNEGRLKLVWSVDSGEGYGIGSVAAGRYFHFDRVDDQARLRCLHAETGRLLWEYQYPSAYEDMYGYDRGPRTSPVVDGNRVYIFGVEGQLTCLSADQGIKRWSVDTADKFGVVQNFFGVGSTPLVHQDLLLVMVGGSDAQMRQVATNQFPDIEPADTAVVAFDKLTGDVKYQLGNDLASYSSIKLMPRKDKLLALAWGRNQLTGFEPLTGQINFRFPWRSRIIESVNASTPVCRDNRVFLSECYGPGGVLLQVESDRAQPDVVWSDRGQRNQSLATHWNTPILHGDHLYGSSGRNSGDAELRCVDWNSGNVRWSQRGLGRASVTYVDDHLLVLGEYGRLLLVKATSEKFEQVAELPENNRAALKYPCWAAPIVAHGLMIARGKDKVVCYDLIPE